MYIYIYIYLFIYIHIYIFIYIYIYLYIYIYENIDCTRSIMIEKRKQYPMKYICLDELDIDGGVCNSTK